MANARMKLQHVPYSEDIEITAHQLVHKNGKEYELASFNLDIPVTGTVYGTLLNYKGAFAALKDQMNSPPYQELPKGPILYIKPSNTLSAFSTPIPLPKNTNELEVGATLGVVFNQTATRVKKKQALEYVEGFTIVNDISIPHQSVYRPALRYKVRDGFCPIGPWVVAKESIANPDDLRISVYINGKLRQENSTAHLIRSIPSLIEDVTDFMTLYPGDVLLIGVPENAPLAKAYDIIRIEIAEIGYLENTIIPEELLQKEGLL